MKAARINSYGDASVIQINDIPAPAPTKQQVLVEVHAASINPFDTTIREGYAKDSIPLDLPVTLGGDLAGIILDTYGAVGLEKGDRIYGQANVVAGNSGAFAELAATGVDQIAKAPNGLSHAEAAALPLVGISALQALTVHLNLQSGEKLFIHGGAGGIGTMAIQIAKHLGAYVAVTASGEGIAYTKQLGADEVIDYTTTHFTDVLSDFDAVFDTVGGEDFEKSFQILKRDGKAVTMIADFNKSSADELGVTALRQATRISNDALNDLTDLVQQGIIRPQIDAVYPLAKIREAFEARESGRVRGKIVLEIR